MFLAIIVGLITGFIVAMPPGPAGVTAMKLSLEQGKRNALLYSFGNALMDFIFCVAAIFATAELAGSIKNFTTENPITILVFQVFVVVFIVIFGILQFKHKIVTKPQKIKKTSKLNFTAKLAARGPFLLGIAIAMTNLANPTFFPSLAFITFNLHKFELIETTSLSNIGFSIGFGAGTFLWFFVIVRLFTSFKTKLSENLLIKINQFAGITLIAVGAILSYRVITYTEWAKLFPTLFAN